MHVMARGPVMITKIHHLPAATLASELGSQADDGMSQLLICSS